MGIKDYFKLLLATVIVTLSLNLSAQRLETIDEVTTTSGSVWKGTITEITDDGYYVITTVSGMTFRLHESAIDNVRQEWIGSRRTKRPYSFKEKGFYQTVEVSVVGNATTGGLSATYSAGHRFSRWIGVGGGVGITGYDIGWGLNVIPLFVEARGFLTQTKVSPYYAVRFGYGIALTNAVNNISEAKGGYLFNPQIGLRFGGGKNVSFYTGLGLNFQRATYTSSRAFSEEVIVDRYLFKRLELKFGITF